MVEALVAISVAAVAGAALLVQFGGHSRFAVDAVDETIAHGMALQLLDEISGCRYHSDGQAANSTSFGPTAWELGGVGRERYDDIDDYHNYAASPPVDRNGVPLGTEDLAGRVRHANFRTPRSPFARWRQSVQVFYVSETNPSTRLGTGASSNLREVEVIISYNDPREGRIPLASARRIFPYIPTP